MKEFKSLSDVDDELLEVAQESREQGFRESEAVYYEHFYFANSEDLIDKDSQVMIKSYMYCTDSKTPPFSSLNETPANFIDKWMIISDEINYIRNQEVKDAKK